ncbi:hypothetical protein D9M69_711150 [compost metagenome]
MRVGGEVVGFRLAGQAQREFGSEDVHGEIDSTPVHSWAVFSGLCSGALTVEVVAVRWRNKARGGRRFWCNCVTLRT